MQPRYFAVIVFVAAIVCILALSSTEKVADVTADSQQLLNEGGEESVLLSHVAGTNAVKKAKAAVKAAKAAAVSALARAKVAKNGKRAKAALKIASQKLSEALRKATIAEERSKGHKALPEQGAYPASPPQMDQLRIRMKEEAHAAIVKAIELSEAQAELQAAQNVEAQAERSASAAARQDAETATHAPIIAAVGGGPLANDAFASQQESRVGAIVRKENQHLRTMKRKEASVLKKENAVNTKAEYHHQVRELKRKNALKKVLHTKFHKQLSDMDHGLRQAEQIMD